MIGKENKVERLNLLLRTIRNIHRLLVKERNLDKLLVGICRDLIKNRGYHNAWIAIFDEKMNLVKYAQGGLEKTFSPLKKLLETGVLITCAQRALCQSDVHVTNDPASECSNCPLASDYGGRAALTIRLEFEGRVYGILAVSTPRNYVKDKEEQELIKEIATDIAYSLHNIEIEAERKQADRVLRESEERYRSIFENTGTATFIIEEDTIILMANTQFEKLSGYSKEEVEGKMKWTEFVADEDLKRMKEYHTKRRRDSGKIPTEYEFKFVDRYGNTKDVFCKVGMIPGTKRSVASWMDITSRKQAEYALQESEQRFRDLVENSLIGISIIQDGRVLYRNPEQKRLLKSFPTALNLLESDNIHPEDVEKVKKLYKSLISGKTSFMEVDFRFYPPGYMNSKPDMKWVYCRASVIQFQGQKGILLNLLDMTKTKEFEQLLMIQDKMTSLGHVAAGIAHEIRNPLSGINIYLNTLEKNFGKRDGVDKEMEIVQRMQSASNKIEAVIRRVMDFSKPSEPQLIFKDINEPIEEALKLSSVTMRKSRIKIEKDLDEKLPSCYIDPLLIEEVILNLITNAADAMRVSTGDKTIHIRSVRGKQCIRLQIADSGPGVPPRMRDKIFDPFFTTKSDSSGIGLSISHRIITDHGGSIEIDTSELGGAEFTIKIPLPKNGRKK